MPGKLVKTATEISIRVAAAGVGAAIAGPLGCALGAAFGHAITGPMGELAKQYAEKFGDKAAEKFFDAGGDALADWAKGPEGDLEGAYREALRLSLRAMRRGSGDDYEDWFEHWERCLKTADVLRLEEIGADGREAGQLALVLRRTMVRLDAQGAALAREGPSIAALNERVMPEELETALATRLPGLFDVRLQKLLVSEKYAAGFKEAQLQFQRFASGTLSKIDVTQDVLVSGQALTNEMLSRVYALTVRRAEEDERIDRAEGRALKAEGEAEEWKRRYLELAADDPSLDALLSTGDLDQAARQKMEQIERQNREQAQSYRELGRIQELRFDWNAAISAYRRAFELEATVENGFQFAHLAQKQNRHKEAIAAYEAVLRLSPDAAILVLNNLAVLYRATQRMREAESVYTEALSLYRTLAKANPEAYLPSVAGTLNNLANLYRDTQRMREAETSYTEALSLRRRLAEANPEAYLPYVATTLNNLAILYGDQERHAEAVEACREAERILRTLWLANPEVHGNQMARTLLTMAGFLGVAGDRVEGCRLAREALGMAYDPGVKAGIGRSIARWCGGGQES